MAPQLSFDQLGSQLLHVSERRTGSCVLGADVFEIVHFAGASGGFDGSTVLEGRDRRKGAGREG